ncbi:MAG TPA: serine/threonine-protein kinase [Phycisphaerae bacterium]|nr:serine/threonine-protein kinase [Phycisphaerae bacterium]
MALSASIEVRFEQYVLDRGLVVEDELKEARRLLNQAEAEGQPLSLPEALVRTGALTKSQAHRVLAALKEETAAPAVQIPGIQLLERLGRGSQAVVYKGKQLSVDRIVAVKILFSKVARDPESKRRFLQEARAAAQLSHNNIVQAIDAGEADGYSFFVQEFVDGTTVDDLLKARGGALPEPEALRIVIQIAEALAHAHSKGFIHRDVKPRNIMLTQDGVAKLADMGLARQVADAGLEEIGKAFGTPYYIAPEQVRGDPAIDFRADIYSLGATFYEMLTGRPPFTAPTPQQVMQKHVAATLVPPDHLNLDLSAGASEVVEVMMSKRPKDRYPTTEDLLVDLRAVAAGQPPRLAREKVGMQTALMEGLAEGRQIPSREALAAPASPFALNQLAILLLVLFAASLLINILLLVFCIP